MPMREIILAIFITIVVAFTISFIFYISQEDTPKYSEAEGIVMEQCVKNTYNGMNKHFIWTENGFECNLIEKGN